MAKQLVKEVVKTSAGVGKNFVEVTATSVPSRGSKSSAQGTTARLRSRSRRRRRGGRRRQLGGAGVEG